MRIASLLSSSTEMLYALGLGEQVVGISHECDYPIEALQKPRLTRTHLRSEATSGEIDAEVRQLLAQGRPLYELDIELLTELQPDLIITQAQCDVCAIRYSDVLEAVSRVPELRRAQVLALNPQSLADVLDDIARIGEAAHARDAAQRYIASLKTRLEAVSQRVRKLDATRRPRVAAIEWIDPLMIAGNWVPELVQLAGGSAGLSDPGRHSEYVPWSAVLAYDPEVIVIAPCGFDLPRTLVECPRLFQQEQWPALTAVRNQRVYAVDGNAYFNRSGPRLIDTLELLAHLLNPSLFPRPAAHAWRQLHAVQTS